MKDILNLLDSIRRPRLLIRAARFGLVDYCRERDQRRLTRQAQVLTPSEAVRRLLSEEAQLEEERQGGSAAYSVSRHVDVMIALMAEARLLPRPAQGTA